jgi:hypothetical protein
MFRESPKGERILRQLSGIAVELTAMAVLVAGMALVPLRSSAGSLGPGEIAMFPKEVAEFAYTDLKSARQYPWFLEFRDELLPPHFREFERFLLTAGIDPNTRVDELAWAQLPTSKKGGEQVVGIGFGSFDPSSNEERFKQQRLPVTNYQGYRLYASGAATGAGEILFTFLDSNMAAFGHRSALEKLVDLRMGRGESLLTNDTLFPLVSEANGGGVIWAVFDKSNASRAIQRFIPQTNLFPQAAIIINRMHAMMINVDAGNSLDVRFHAVCDSVDDANFLGAALQAGLLYRRYQEEQTHPDLAQEMLESIRVMPRGDRLIVESSLSDDQLGALIKSKAFAVPM